MSRELRLSVDEIKPGAVHRSPEMYVTTEGKARKTSARRRLKTVRSVPQIGTLPTNKVGRIAQNVMGGKKKRRIKNRSSIRHRTEMPSKNACLFCIFISVRPPPQRIIFRCRGRMLDCKQTPLGITASLCSM